MKKTSEHGKTPILRNFDGKVNDLNQEGAITRYLANELNLAGQTHEEKAKCIACGF